MDSPDLPGAARHAPATLRNRDAIAGVLHGIFSPSSRVLEIASGSGEHGLYLSSLKPGWTWQPTDRQADALASINAWRETTATPMRPPFALDVLDARWHDRPSDAAGYDSVFCANMIHIAPPDAADGLIKTVAAQLEAGGDFVLYGPFMVAGHHTAPSNAAFDESLKARDPSWGIRDLGSFVEQARQYKLVHEKTYRMPANNLCVHFKKTSKTPHALR